MKPHVFASWWFMAAGWAMVGLEAVFRTGQFVPFGLAFFVGSLAFKYKDKLKGYRTEIEEVRK